MVVRRNNRLIIHIPGVTHLLPTPMPNLFSIENEQLHYDAHGEDEDVDPEAEMPEDIDVEAGEPEYEVQPPGPYATYGDAYELGENIENISNLANTLRDTTIDLTSRFDNWKQGWTPGNY